MTLWFACSSIFLCSPLLMMLGRTVVVGVGGSAASMDPLWMYHYIQSSIALLPYTAVLHQN
jgi:hypothetical protein